MKFTYIAFAMVALAGCTTAQKSPYDLTAVCLTDEGKPVSKGMTYKGKTCGQSDMPIADGKPTPLVWR
ncbi:hypothetical protein F9K91_18975 [Brucella tritici]|jgi:hypothetical protein|uniref:Lipoprotein n=1 Tax=Brucella tritici TaxID=94626 RepID=A0A833FND2_9HYPH|nr:MULTISPECIES: hypothetical protein [Brucella]KAB2663312.1 hypothetical protein F9K91_18975 [Brucella tritici]KAB2695361.1 hypothetical protein F9K79_18800 [Ochrobactrum sp. Kaboul]MCR5943829.1 hypothetical protein [Ochrobactrum sp. XJ1]PJO45698.1 hypothetical protein CWE02_23205 [Brucella pituitosa]